MRKKQNLMNIQNHKFKENVEEEEINLDCFIFSYILTEDW